MKRLVLSLLILVLFALAGSVARGGEDSQLYRRALQAYKQGQYRQAVELLEAEVEESPENVAAYRYLAMSYEALKRWSKAVENWQNYKTLSESAADRTYAASRIAACRARMTAGRQGPVPQKPPIPLTDLSDPRLAVVDKAWHTVTSEHFVVKSKNARLSRLVASKSEEFLQYISSVFLAGRAWPHTGLPITVYPDHHSYVLKGGNPPWSGGLTGHDVKWGSSTKVDLFQRDRRGRLLEGLVDRVLIHELTHVVLAEFFGTARPPLWLHEAMAQAMELVKRDQDMYERMVLIERVRRGDYISLQQLFAAKRYPTDMAKLSLFYCESEAIGRMMLDTWSREQVYTFMTSLRAGDSTAEAMAKVMGTSPADAVSTFERQWRQWVLSKYAATVAGISRLKGSHTGDGLTFTPAIARRECDRIDAVRGFRAIFNGRDLDGFSPPIEHASAWTVRRGRLRGVAPAGCSRLLRLQKVPSVPFVLRVTARAVGDSTGYLGLVLLDHLGRRVAGVRCKLPAEPAELHVFVGDELVIYVGRQCYGRAFIRPWVAGGLPDGWRYALELIDGTVEIERIERAIVR